MFANTPYIGTYDIFLPYMVDLSGLNSVSMTMFFNATLRKVANKMIIISTLNNQDKHTTYV